MTDIYTELRQKVKAGDVLEPGDAGYEESLKRWSASSERRAVSIPSSGATPPELPLLGAEALIQASLRRSWSGRRAPKRCRLRSALPRPIASR